MDTIPGTGHPGRPADADGTGRDGSAGSPPSEAPPKTVTGSLDGDEDRERLRRATGTGDPHLRKRLIRDMMGCLAVAGDGASRPTGDAVGAALAALEALEPADAVDGMLGVQAVACHAAAMDCLHRAARRDGPAAARDWNLRHAARLMALYGRQIEALDRRRAARSERRPPADEGEPPATVRRMLFDAGTGQGPVLVEIPIKPGRGKGRGTGRGRGP